MTDIDAMLKDRIPLNGDYENRSRICQSLKRVMRDTPNWSRMTDYQKESLEMIVHKISRILNGDPDSQDSWDDIAGYAKLGYIEKKAKIEPEKQCSSSHSLFITKNGIITNALHNSLLDPLQSEYYPALGDRLAMHYNGIAPTHFTVKRVNPTANTVSMLKMEDGFEVDVEYSFGALEGLKLYSREKT